MFSYRYLSIAGVSLSLLMTELFWTRLFSAEFYYTFAFLVLSLAVLGIGLGALMFTMVIRTPRAGLLPVWLTGTGLAIVAAVPLVFLLRLDFAALLTDPVQPLRVLAAVLLLGLPHFLGGVSIAHILKANSDDIPRLYRADFLGAAAGVVGFILSMNALGGLSTLLLCAAPVTIAALLLSPGLMKLLPALSMTAAASWLISNGDLPEQPREERAPVIYRHWDATAKIKVYEYDSTARGINIDNLANTPVYRFDGNWNVPDSEQVQFDIDVRNLITRFPHCRFLSLGAGGGGDVLQALQYNAAEIHAVEVIPHINFLLQKGMLREFSGNIYHDPRVHVVTEDARAYVRGFRNHFDVIYSLSSNTFAAFASGSFAMAENYLFTREAFKDYWVALSDSGYMSLEHQFYGPRLAAALMEALVEMGVPDPALHIAVFDLATLRRKLLLISKRPLDDATIEGAFANSSPRVLDGMRRLYPPATGTRGNLYDIIVTSGWRAAADTARINISPSTDDRPFIAQLGLLRNFAVSQTDRMPMFETTGFPLSRVIMIALLVVSLLIVVPANVLPYLRRSDTLPARPWLYFFAIGLGYMMIEVVLIQQYALLIGSTIATLALVLGTLLVSGGIGSGRCGRHSPMTVFLFIVLWLAADMLFFPSVVSAAGAWPLPLRLIVAGVLIAPLGYFMGMPFPKAVSHYPGLADWAFAITGSASVVGSVAVMLIATAAGYTAALGGALAMYLGAAALYRGGKPDRS